MMKKQENTFRELPPPQLSKIFTVTQPENDLINEHWKHLFSALEWQLQVKQKILCVVYKCKAQLSLIVFQDSCLLYQRKFKIIYGQAQEITCLKLHPITIKHQNANKKELVVVIGYFDGVAQIYHLNISAKSIFLRKLLSLEGNNQPVTNIIISKGNLIVSRIHSVHVYQDSLPVVANFIISSQGKREDNNQEYFCTSKVLPINNMEEGMKLSMSAGLSAVHVFNQSQGSKSYLYGTFQQFGTIVDSITFLVEMLDQNLALGDTNDKLKLIYKKRKLVERYYGFKNYCSDACYRLFQQSQELWVGDLNGCLTYFERGVDMSERQGQKGALRMIEIQTHFSIKIVEAGIKKLIVSGRMMVVLDSQSNIHFFDIIRKQSSNSEIDIESMEDYSSQN